MNENEKNFLQDAKNTEKNPSLKKEKKESVKKSAKRFTALDLAVIVVVLLCIVGIGFRSAIADLILTNVPKETITVTVKADNLTSDTLALLKAEDELYLANEKIGVLTSFSYQNATRVTEQKSADGAVSFVTVEDPAAYTVFAEVTLSGHYGDSGFVILDTENLYVGKILNISTSLYQITVIITEIPRK